MKLRRRFRGWSREGLKVLYVVMRDIGPYVSWHKPKAHQWEGPPRGGPSLACIDIMQLAAC